MFDIGWSEMLVVGVVALIVVGPKDLPKMFHTLGEVTGKARSMAREFQRAMDVAAKESGMGDIVRDIKRTTSGQSFKEATGLDGLAKEFRDLKDLGTGKPAATKAGPTMPPKPVPAEGTPEAVPEHILAGTGTEPDATQSEAIAAEDLARRNAELSETEKQRLKKQKQTEAARLKAAAIRAQKEADAAAAAAAAAADDIEPES